MTSDSKQMNELEQNRSNTIEEIIVLEKEFKFKYRSATGELIFAMVTCRQDISFHTTKLSQYNGCPGRKHFEAVRKLLLYVRDTASDGIYFWRKEPNMELPVGEIPITRTEPYHRIVIPENTQGDATFGLVDSDWASDTTHRKSVSGIGIMYAGALIAYKSNFQKVPALSSTEAEFSALVDGGKSILYIRSVLSDLGIEQHHATPVYEDNQGAIAIIQSRQPTKRIRHVDTKQFVALDWVETDLMTVHKISTHDNPVDALTKAIPVTLFYRHNEVLMGKLRPAYSKYALGNSKRGSSHKT